MRHLLIALFALGIAAGTIACNSPGANNSNEILIGEVEALTGSEAAFGTSTHKGIELAIEEVNAAGGIKGRKLRVLALDDQGKPDEAALAATKLITQDKVLAVISGSNSTRCLAMVPIAQGRHLPFVATGATNPKVTEQGDYIFRTTFIDPFQGVVMATFTAKTLGLKKVAILKDMRSDYSIGLAEYFSRTFKKEGGTITSEQTYSFGEVDFKSQLTSMVATRPDAIFIPGYYTEVALVARQAHELGVKAVLLGADGWDSPKLKEIAGAAIAGGYFSAQYSPESQDPQVLKFIKAFKT
ncbi:MAG: ABC transporter substrate-binding protein, partial [Deltaproteobacteria bacterium]|nr:ABC transporter substrate-binding protein [Deltaproteobacteria bacterium]